MLTKHNKTMQKGEGDRIEARFTNTFKTIRCHDLLSVSRCQAKPQRPLVDEDFTSAHKLAFDM